MKRVALAVLFASSAGSFAANLETGAAWGFVGAALLSIFWRRSGPAPRLLGLGKRLLHLTLVLMGILGWILVTYPIVSTSALHFSSLVLGYGFGAFGIFFLLRDGLPPREGAIPAAIGLMTVSSFDVLAKVQPYLLAAAAAGFLYLASEVLGAGTHRRRARAMVLAAFAILSIAAARGIALLLPWAQGKVEVAMMAAYVPAAGDGEGNRRLGDLRSLKLSKKVVMRVYSERPQKLRSGVLVRFDGASWHADPSTMRTLAPTSEVELSGRELAFLRSIPGSDFLLDPGALLGSRLVHTSVVRVEGSGLPTPGGSRVLHAPLEGAHVDSAGIVQPPPRVAVRWYGILHELDHRRSQRALLEGSERESSLQLPPALDPRIPALAREVIEGAPGEEGAVEKVASHLRDEYRYSLEVGVMDPRDPLADFLFRKKEGWCEYFATSAAILLRTQGIPARYVYGFNVIGSQRKADYYLVRDWDRHAWIEAYIEGKGWIEYDPTPAAEYESLHAGLDRGFWSDGMEWLSARLANLYVRLPHIDTVKVAWALGLLVLAYLLGRILRRLRRRVKTLKPRDASPPPTGIEHLVSRLDRLASELGYPRRRSTPPFEHWNSIPRNRLEDGPREFGLRILESYYRARFGGVPISPSDVESLERSLHRLVPRI